MAAPYILARSFEEAHVFARQDLGLGKGSYYVVSTPSPIRGLFGADLYLVPGWEQRFDRFAMQDALRWTKMNVIDVGKQEDVSPVAVPGQLPLPDVDGNGENMIYEGSPVAPDPETRRRRRRCKECGILVDPDDVDSHAEAHEHDLLGGA